MKDTFLQLKYFVKRNEARLSSVALIAGFIFDSLTLTRIDRVYDNIVIVIYLVLVGASILFVHLTDREFFQKLMYIDTKPGEYAAAFKAFLPVIIQFAFGGLFSAFFIFYTRSATLQASWPFLLVLLTLLIANERVRKHYARLTFQVSVYFFVLLSYFIFALPLLLHTIGVFVFLLSGMVAVLFLTLYLWLLSYTTPSAFEKSKKYVVMSCGAIFILINVFYFTNVIPPIPLALKEEGVYHSIERLPSGEYRVTKERTRQSWLSQGFDFLRSRSVFHTTGRESVFVFSAVFAPTDLKTNIVHEWQYYSNQRDEWVTTDTISFPVVGGRDGGYRGYSQKSRVSPGLWRVNVETPTGLTIGRSTFEVKAVGKAPPRESEVL